MIPRGVPVLDAQRAVLGAMCRGSLTARDMVDLRPGWWRLDHASAFVVALGELHGRILAAIEAHAEARPGERVDLRWLLVIFRDMWGYSIGCEHDGRLLGYLPELARRAGARPMALRALDVLLWTGEQEADARAGAEAVARAVWGSRLVQDAGVAHGMDERGRAQMAGVLLVAALGGVVRE